MHRRSALIVMLVATACSTATRDPGVPPAVEASDIASPSLPIDVLARQCVSMTGDPIAGCTIGRFERFAAVGDRERYYALTHPSDHSGCDWAVQIFESAAGSDVARPILGSSEMHSRLPPGHEGRKGVSIDLTTMRAESDVWLTGDYMCCPTGGIVVVDLDVQDGRIVVRDVRSSTATE